MLCLVFVYVAYLLLFCDSLSSSVDGSEVFGLDARLSWEGLPLMRLARTLRLRTGLEFLEDSVEDIIFTLRRLDESFFVSLSLSLFSGSRYLRVSLQLLKLVVRKNVR